MKSEIRPSVKAYGFLSNLLTALAKVQSVEGVAREALDLVLAYVQWPSGVLFVESSASGTLEAKASVASSSLLSTLLDYTRKQTHQEGVLPPLIVEQASTAPRTIVQLPLQVHHRPLGWLVLAHPEAGVLTSHMKDALVAASQHIGAILENLSLMQEMDGQTQSIQALLKVARSMTGPDQAGVLKQMLRELNMAIPYDVGGVLMTLPSSMEVVHLSLEASPECVSDIEVRLQRIMETLGQPAPVLKSEQRVILADKSSEVLHSGQLLSYLEAAVMQSGQPVGAILLARRRPFRPREQRLLLIVADQLSNTCVPLGRESVEGAEYTSGAASTVQHVMQNPILDNIFYELHNPATFIQGYLELMADEGLGPLTTAQQKAVTTLLEQSRWISRLVHDLGALKFIEPQVLQYQFVDLEPLVQQAVQAMEDKAAQKALTMGVTCAPDLSPVWLDPERIMHVLESLLDNAIRFTPSGGHVYLSIQDVGQTHVKVSVCDEGPGVAPVELPFIFQYRGQDKPNRTSPGLGIGLALAQRIVEAHGGHIAVQGNPGSGSTFYFILPLRR